MGLAFLQLKHQYSIGPPTLLASETSTDGTKVYFTFTEAMSDTSTQGSLFSFSPSKTVSNVGLKSGDSSTIEVSVSSAFLVSDTSITCTITSGLAPASGHADYPGISNTPVTNKIPDANELTDLFTGTTIDTGKWAVTNPDSSVIPITQNNKLTATGQSGTDTSPLANYVETVKSFSGNISYRMDLTKNLQDANEPAVYFALYIDANNVLYLTRTVNDTHIRIVHVKGGSVVYDYTSTTIAFNNSFKVKVSGTSVYCYYWDGSQWVQFGTTQTLTSSLSSAKLRWYVQKSGTIYSTYTLDNVYVRTNDFTTLNPS
jgi:hypothetical protein